MKEEPTVVVDGVVYTIEALIEKARPLALTKAMIQNRCKHAMRMHGRITMADAMQPRQRRAPEGYNPPLTRAERSAAVRARRLAWEKARRERTAAYRHAYHLRNERDALFMRGAYDIAVDIQGTHLNGAYLRYALEPLTSPPNPGRGTRA